jgi:hypothetical protein
MVGNKFSSRQQQAATTASVNASGGRLKAAGGDAPLDALAHE